MVTVESLAIPAVKLLRLRVFGDERGQFTETWRSEHYAALGIGPFVQDNVSVSRKGVLRGMHLQHPDGQAKLVTALRGRIFDVAVDLRLGSPTFGRWVGAELSDREGTQLYIPAGFAHGFVTLSDEVVFGYKVSSYYAPKSELALRWDDPTVAIEWPIRDPIVAPKDAAAPTLDRIDRGAFPVWVEGAD